MEVLKNSFVILALIMSPALCVAQTDADFDDGEIDLNAPSQQTDKKEMKARTNDNVKVDVETPHEITLEDFSSFKLHYMADFDNFDKGSYGIGGHMFGTKGFGLTYGLYCNAGIVDISYATFGFTIGPCAGFNLGDYVALFTPLQGYFSWTSTGSGSSKKAFGWSLGVEPTIAFRLGKIIIYAGVPLSYNFETEKFGKALEVALGFNF